MVKEEISDEESAIPLMPEPEDEIIASVIVINFLVFNLKLYFSFLIIV